MERPTELYHSLWLRREKFTAFLLGTPGGFSLFIHDSQQDGFSVYAGSCSRFLPVKQKVFLCHCADLVVLGL